MLTQEEIKNISVLIGKAPITGNEAAVVVLLQQKLKTMSDELTKPSK